MPRPNCSPEQQPNESFRWQSRAYSQRRVSHATRARTAAGPAPDIFLDERTVIHAWSRLHRFYFLIEQRRLPQTHLRENGAPVDELTTSVSRSNALRIFEARAVARLQRIGASISAPNDSRPAKH